ncbi:MAG: hypothetical protein FVQ83_01200 [Chloroflexi bacterium]|nr:hypothetical protein [Chloroflexota bacterium]
MFKKIIFAMLIAVLLALPFGASVYADGPDGEGSQGPRDLERFGGKVTDINSTARSFTIQKRGGDSVTFDIDEDTRYRSRSGEFTGFDDLELDMVVIVFAKEEESGLLAKVVVALDQAILDAERAAGRVVSIGTNSFTMQTRAGETLTLQVDDQTRFISRGRTVNGLEDLEEGMRVGVLYTIQEDGSLLAKAVLAGRQNAGERPEGQRPDGEGSQGPRDLERFGGKVTDINSTARSFTIQKRGGDSVTFDIDEDTRYRSRSGEFTGFDDLELDMVVIVFAKEEESGLLAKVVVALDQAILDAERAAGRVVSIGTNSFTMQTRAGETLTLQVDDQTRFISRGRTVNGLEDLEEGMRVGVLYTIQEDGSLLAKAVLAGRQNAGERPEGQRPDGEGPDQREPGGRPAEEPAS